MARVVTLVFSVVIAASAAHAQTLTPQNIDALNNLQEEFATCGAYYRTEIACATPEWKERLQTQLGPTIKLFDAMAVSIGSKIGMTQDAIEQRLRRVFEQQSRLTNGNVCLNIDTLYAQHNSRCKQLAEHPEATMDEYMRRP
jgi:hypothetical protein